MPWAGSSVARCESTRADSPDAMTRSTTSSRHLAFSRLGTASDFNGSAYVAEYVHERTGATHFHVRAKTQDLGCLVGVHTPASSDRGVAHVLEHMVMRGSARFDSDLRARLMRASLRTYTSAFTRIDWTAFAFASRSNSDFFQLLRVHLDGVFHPRLDEEAFGRADGRSGAGAGCRAIVLNEMRGVLESPLARSWYALARHLYGDSPYRFNNCGVPEKIRACTLREVADYHRAHYDPRAVVFVTYGRVRIDRAHALMDEALTEALTERRRSPPPAKPAALPRIPSATPREEYATAVDAPRVDLLVGWRLPRCRTFGQLLDCRLLAELLFAGRDAPLVRALEDVDVGARVSPLSGLEDGYPDPALVCGVVDCDERAADRLDAALDGVLSRLAKRGISRARIDGALARVSLALRRTRTGDHPYWLGPTLAPARSALRGFDARSFFAVGDAFADLERRAAEPEYVRGLVERCLIDHPNRVRLALVATPRGRRSFASPTHAEAGESPSERRRRRGREHRAVDLPLTPLAKGHRTVSERASVTERARGALWTCAAETQGVVHQHTAVLLDGVPEHLVDLLPVTTKLLLHAAQRDGRGVPPGILEGSLEVRASTEDVRHLRATWVVQGDCLAPDFAGRTALLRRGIEVASKISLPELVGSLRQALVLQRHALVHGGHRHLIWAAGAGLRPAPGAWHRWHGIQATRVAERLLRELLSPRTRGRRVEAVSETARLLGCAAKEHLVVAEVSVLDATVREWQAVWRERRSGRSGARVVDRAATPDLRGAAPPTQVAWLSDLEQAGCAVAYGTAPASHPDSAALTVLAHAVDEEIRATAREIRGAYACGAGHDATNGLFHVFSFRDPDVLRTVDDFLDLQRRVARGYNRDVVTLATRAALRALEPSASPIEDARTEFTNQRTGRTSMHRQAYRDSLLAVEPEDLARVAARYLCAAPSVAILAPRRARHDLERRGFATIFAAGIEE